MWNSDWTQTSCELITCMFSVIREALMSCARWSSFISPAGLTTECPTTPRASSPSSAGSRFPTPPALGPSWCTAGKPLTRHFLHALTARYSEKTGASDELLFDLSHVKCAHGLASMLQYYQPQLAYCWYNFTVPLGRMWLLWMLLNNAHACQFSRVHSSSFMFY